MRAFLAALTVSMLATGCATAKFTRRYDTALTGMTAPDDTVEFGFSTQDVASTPTIIRGADLGPEAQAELAFAIVNGPKPRSAAEAIRELGSVQIISKASGEFVDRTKVSRRLIIATAHPLESRATRLADRIQAIRFRVELPSSGGAEFSGWNKAISEYATVDLGSITAKNTVGLTAEVVPRVGGSLETMKLGGSYTDEVSEAVKLQQQYLKLTGSLRPRIAALYQEGAPGIDLTGNLIFDVELTFRSASFSPIYEATGLGEMAVPGNPSDVRIIRRFVLHTEKEEPLCGTLKVEYILRHVVSGQRSASEHDDQVAYWRGEKTLRNVEIVPDQAFQAYSLRTADNRTLTFNGFGNPEAVMFDSRAEALNFLAWLGRAGDAQIGNGTLWDADRNRPFTKDELRKMILVPPKPKRSCPAPALAN